MPATTKSSVVKNKIAKKCQVTKSDIRNKMIRIIYF